MTPEKIARINALAHKAKTEGLTPEETMERDALRREYIDAVKTSLTAHLDHTYVMDEHGTVRKLKKREK